MRGLFKCVSLRLVHRVLSRMEYEVLKPWLLGGSSYSVTQFITWRDAFCLDHWHADCEVFSAPVCIIAATALALIAFTISRPIGTTRQQRDDGHLALHNQVNLVLLPLMMSLAALSTVGLLPQRVTGWSLALYMLLDFSWISIWPQAVASKPKLILVHHCVTAACAASSVMVREEFAYMCCW